VLTFQGRDEPCQSSFALPHGGRLLENGFRGAKKRLEMGNGLCSYAFATTTKQNNPRAKPNASSKPSQSKLQATRIYLRIRAIGGPPRAQRDRGYYPPSQWLSGLCSCCGEASAGYDTLPTRRFQFVPFWGFPVHFVYAMRRVECVKCGVKVEKVLWGDGKKHFTGMFACFIVHWAKYLSWSATSREFGISWKRVFECVENAVDWGLARRDLSDITAIGIDEIARSMGHKYVTLVYRITGAKSDFFL
jgi:hypothetical protein